MAKRSVGRVVLSFLALVLAGCGDDAALDRLAAAGKGRVAEVRAGDVVALAGGEPVKLAGLASFRRGDPHAREARAALEGLVLGKEVELLSGGAARDPFGRRVAHLRLAKGRAWVQGEMLEAGAARVRTFPDQRAMAAQMLEHEARARAGRRGLWSLKAYEVRLPWEAARGFAVVEGRVSAVRPIGEGFELDMQGMRLEIPGRAAGDFAAAGKAAPELSGKLVRVRGTVRYAGGMRLDHPEAVEVLSDP